MKNYKYLFVIIVIIAFGTAVSGCGLNSAPKKVVWYIQDNLSDKVTEEINKVLKQKNLPISIEFRKSRDKEELSEAREKEKQIDIVPYSQELEQDFISLNSYLEEEQGAKLKSAYHKKIWELLEQNGTIRLIPRQVFYANGCAYEVDKELT